MLIAAFLKIARAVAMSLADIKADIFVWTPMLIDVEYILHLSVLASAEPPRDSSAAMMQKSFFVILTIRLHTKIRHRNLSLTMRCLSNAVYKRTSAWLRMMY